MIAAVIPAAGRSERMGRPKLTLPVGGVPLIVRVVTALRRGGADRVVVVAPPASILGASLLAQEARRAGAELVLPDLPPPDMRASVEFGLAHLSAGTPPSTLLLAPGDSPGITPELVARVVERSRADLGALVVPSVGGRRGHPVAFPWSLASEIPRLPAGTGVNLLVRRHAGLVTELLVEDAGALADLDTPEDYRRWESTGECHDR